MFITTLRKLSEQENPTCFMCDGKTTNLLAYTIHFLSIFKFSRSITICQIEYCCMTIKLKIIMIIPKLNHILRLGLQFIFTRSNEIS